PVAGVHRCSVGEDVVTVAPWNTATPYDSPGPRSLAIRRTASFARAQRSRKPMLPDPSRRMRRARGVGRTEDANAESVASTEKRTYRSPLLSTTWLRRAPAARNGMF